VDMGGDLSRVHNRIKTCSDKWEIVGDDPEADISVLYSRRLARGKVNLHILGEVIISRNHCDHGYAHTNCVADKHDPETRFYVVFFFVIRRIYRSTRDLKRVSKE
jgi:hypothetical protein